MSAWRTYLLSFFKGALIGVGAILPGVSGGVLCVAFGVYEPMIAFLSHPLQSFKKNYRLLIPIIIGGLVGFVLLAKAVELFLATSAAAAMALFCGLICGTIPELMHQSAVADRQKGWTALIIALIASFIFFQILDRGVVGTLEANFAWYIFCGVIWGLSMVIPGLSSSSILLFMGLYQPMAQGIGNLDFQVLLPLAAGFIITVAVSAKIVNRVIERYYAVFSKVILGFVISSVLMIVPTSFANATQVAVSLLCFIAGFFLARWMDLHRTYR